MCATLLMADNYKLLSTTTVLMPSCVNVEVLLYQSTNGQTIVVRAKLIILTIIPVPWILGTLVQTASEDRTRNLLTCVCYVISDAYC